MQILIHGERFPEGVCTTTHKKTLACMLYKVNGCSDEFSIPTSADLLYVILDSKPNATLPNLNNADKVLVTIACFNIAHNECVSTFWYVVGHTKAHQIDTSIRIFF